MCVLMRIGPLHACNLGSKLGDSMRTLLEHVDGSNVWCVTLRCNGECLTGQFAEVRLRGKNDAN